MGGKKTPGRFTIQFNMEDPQQRAAAEFLEQQGRRKAQLLTNAVLRYLQTGQGCGEGPAGVSEEALEQMMLSILKKNPQLTSGRDAVPAAAKAAPPEPWADAGGDDALRAITNTLAAFQKQ